MAIPGFRSDALNCGLTSDSLTPQLDAICLESVRFTHAYTPSVLSNPALASILTGLYPVEHGIHRNDASRYNPDVRSLPEMAKSAGYGTFFVSGGVPALRKAGISKGFDDFDDSIRMNGSFYRPAEQTIKKFQALIDNRSEGIKFLGILQLADLMFTEVVLPGERENDKMEGTYNGKLQDIDEALGHLKGTLKKMKIWDPLTVVIVGLHGTEKTEHDGLSKGLNLYDEIVRVPLLIKPGRKPRDEGPGWKVDAPVSLVDLGLTLMKLLGGQEFKASIFPVRDLSDALQAKDFQTGDSPIFCESDLPRWRNWGPRLVSMRFGEWVYWPPPESKLFNTYTDRLQLNNVFFHDFGIFSQAGRIWEDYKNLINPEFKDEIHFLPVSVSEKLRVAKVLFSKSSKSDEKVRELTYLELRRPDDWQIFQWHVQSLIEAQNRLELHRILKSRKVRTPQEKQELSAWLAMDQVGLKLKDDHKAGDEIFDCLPLLPLLRKNSFTETDAVISPRDCEDKETRAWIQAYIYFKLKHPKEMNALIDVAKGYTDKRIEQTEFAKAFWLDGATWDFRQDLPEGPSIFEIFMSVSGNSEFTEFTRKKLGP